MEWYVEKLFDQVGNAAEMLRGKRFPYHSVNKNIQVDLLTEFIPKTLLFFLWIWYAPKTKPAPVLNLKRVWRCLISWPADRTGPINYIVKLYHSTTYKGPFSPAHLFAHLYFELQILCKCKQISSKTNRLSTNFLEGSRTAVLWLQEGTRTAVSFQKKEEFNEAYYISTTKIPAVILQWTSYATHLIFI